MRGSAPTEIQSTPAFSKISNIPQNDSAGSLRANLSPRVVQSHLLDRLTHRQWIHVIEQDDIRIVRNRRARQFVENW